MEDPSSEVNPALLKPISNPWRNRILFELHLRPMSPKRFSSAFKGVDVATVSRYFRELREWGFLEVAEELRGGKRRGAGEKVYRAIRHVHLHSGAWSGMARYLREECSGVILKSFVCRSAAAMHTGSLNEASSRHLSNSALTLDRASWNELAVYLDETLDWIARLEIDAGYRMAASGEHPTSQTVALLAYRTPRPSVPSQCLPEVGQPEAIAAADHFLMSPQTAKAMAEPWRGRILSELYLQPMSPRGFEERFGGPDLATTARYFRQLRDWGFLEVIEEIRGGRRRGAVEKIYRFAPRSYAISRPWRGVPRHLTKRGFGLQLGQVIDQVEEAFRSGSFDEEIDRHATWLVLWLDRQGWRECLSRLQEAQAWIRALSERASVRIQGGSGEALSVRAAVLGFPSPEEFPWTELTEAPIGFAPDLTACRAAA